MAKNILVIAKDKDVQDFLSRLFYNLGHDVYLQSEYELESYPHEQWRELSLVIVDAPKDPADFELELKKKSESAMRAPLPSAVLIPMPFAERAKTEEERDFLKAELVVRQRELEADLSYDRIFLKRSFNVEKFVEALKPYLQ